MRVPLHQLTHHLHPILLSDEIHGANELLDSDIDVVVHLHDVRERILLRQRVPQHAERLEREVLVRVLPSQHHDVVELPDLRSEKVMDRSRGRVCWGLAEEKLDLDVRQVLPGVGHPRRSAMRGGVSDAVETQRGPQTWWTHLSHS